MSVFTEILTELTQHSAAVDTGRVTPNSFIELQRLEDRIIRAYNTGYYTHTEKQALYNVAQALHKEYRALLKLD